MRCGKAIKSNLVLLPLIYSLTEKLDIPWIKRNSIAGPQKLQGAKESD